MKAAARSRARLATNVGGTIGAGLVLIVALRAGLGSPSASPALAGDRLARWHCILTGHLVEWGPCPRCHYRSDGWG